jgi:hypothetical protein
MTLSWKELVCHGLLNQIEEPVVVKNILKMVIRYRCAYLSEEARDVHSKYRQLLVCCSRFTCKLRPSDPLDKLEFNSSGEYVSIGYRVWLAGQLHNITVNELKSSWKEIVLKFRKKRRERLRCGSTGYTAKLPEGGRPRSQDPGASDARLCVWGVI